MTRDAPELDPEATPAPLDPRVVAAAVALDTIP